MEWFTENPVGMLAMQDYMQKFLKEFQYDVVQVASDVFTEPQLMGPVYRHRKGVAYIPLDGTETVYSAAQQKMVKSVPFDIMQETPAQTMAIVVRELKRRRRGVKRMRLGEVWLSPPCNTYCKLGPINKEHQFRDAKNPLRKPIR